MGDLFDSEPKPNSPEDLGGFVPRGERVQPWDPRHPDHPAQRPENQLEPGEGPPPSWNVARTDLGIVHMRKFLAWCDDKGIDPGRETVGSLYVALNVHSLDAFRWLCTQISRTGIRRLPSAGTLSKAILQRDPALLYSDPSPNQE